MCGALAASAATARVNCALWSGAGTYQRGLFVTCAVFQAMDALPDIGFPLAVDSQQPQKLTVCIYGGGVETLACQLLGMCSE